MLFMSVTAEYPKSISSFKGFVACQFAETFDSNYKHNQVDYKLEIHYNFRCGKHSRKFLFLI